MKMPGSGHADLAAYNPTTTKTQKLPWKRLLAEATAIVLSSLLAFAIDAWWEDRGDRQAEEQLLHRLKADFSE